MPRRLMVMLSVFMIFLLFLEGSASACVGARPLGMGGAFIGVEGDPSSVYWNPGALFSIGRDSVSMTSTLNNRGRYNYDDFMAVVTPIGDYGAFGVSLTENRDDPLSLSSTCLVLSFSRGFGDILGVGINLRYQAISYTDSHLGRLDGTGMGADLGILLKFSPRFSAGLLLQDVGDTFIYFRGARWRYETNLRAGIAYKPTEEVTVTADLYSINSEHERSVRFGAEWEVLDGLRLRGGYYGLPIEMYGLYGGAPTIGVGYAIGNVSIDYAFLGKSLGNTHQIGVKIEM